MAEIVYFLCAVMSLICAALLARGYRRTGQRLLLWSFLCFGFIALNNVILLVDLVLLPGTNIHGPFLRNIMSATGSSLMLFGLIWEVT